MINQGIFGKGADRTKVFQEPYIISDQIHDNKIYLVTEFKTQQLQGYDGFITNLKGLRLIIKVADCTPILIHDPVKEVIAAIHAGRKGTELGITKEAIKIFKEKFGSSPADLIAWIGPSICVNCYQIDREKDTHFDLWGENKKQLLTSGLKPQNIQITGQCTSCNANNEFYSYRKDKTAERNYVFISQE